MSELVCPVCETTDIMTHADRYECATCGHEWKTEAASDDAPAERVVKDAYGHRPVPHEIASEFLGERSRADGCVAIAS